MTKQTKRIRIGEIMNISLYNDRINIDDFLLAINKFKELGGEHLEFSVNFDWEGEVEDIDLEVSKEEIEQLILN